jgi:hypothetical protein
MLSLHSKVSALEPQAHHADVTSGYILPITLFLSAMGLPLKMLFEKNTGLGSRSSCRATGQTEGIEYN